MNKHVQYIDRILKRNRYILQQLASRPSDRSITHCDLELHGFNFHHYTHSTTTSDQKIIHFCYEFGYHSLDSGYFAIVKDETIDEGLFEL